MPTTTDQHLFLGSPVERSLIRNAGLSAIALGVGYVAIIVLYVSSGALPNETQLALRHLAAHAWKWKTIVVASAITDLLFIPVVWALLRVLKGIRDDFVISGTIAVGLFVVLDLSITWPNYSAMIMLGEKYTTTGNESEALSYLTTALYSHEILKSDLTGVYLILIPSIGIFLLGIGMQRGPFGNAAYYSALATGTFGVAAVIGGLFVESLELIAVAASVFTTLWVLFTGFDLLRISCSSTKG